MVNIGENRTPAIVWTEIEQIKTYSGNARTHDKEQINQIKNSIEEFGFLNPILLDKNHEILAGHGRLAAAKLLGLKAVPTIKFDHLSESQKIAYTLADNRIAENSGWDFDQLKLEFEKLHVDEFNFDLLGFDDDELDDLIPQSVSSSNKNQEEIEDNLPDLDENIYGVLRGDIWQLGNHRIMCGDSTDKLDVDILMNGEKADMVFTDPPYNVASESKNVAASVSKAMNDLKNADWDKNFEIELVLNIIKNNIDNGSIYVWCNHFLFSRIMSCLSPWAKFNGWNVWTKPNPMPSLMKRHWTWNSELCCYFTIGKHTFNFPENGHALASWSFNKIHVATEGVGHPTQKPIKLCEHVINHSSNKGKMVLDLFLGSGSTLIACEKTGRKCYGMEIDPHYCSVIIKRWEDYTGLKAERINNAS